MGGVGIHTEGEGGNGVRARAACTSRAESPPRPTPSRTHLGSLPDPREGRVLGRDEEGLEDPLQPLGVVVVREEGGHVPNVRAVEEPQGAEEEGPRGQVGRGVGPRQHGHLGQERGGGQAQEARRVLAREHPALCVCVCVCVCVCACVCMCVCVCACVFVSV